ncbi:MAG TPA: hypothetical protein DCX25_04230 [Candidatus Pacebacteria bacterium]|nr:MAG: hypothetical protein UX00_C0007G0005 [Microgenomates group bacterium GW2011_GWB1_45_17]KKU23519.1 MAG: hypothetical protein UX35_C0005G0021 [Microgenomates group bacterium GW2011_GWA1_46_15]KKU24404.1 MAG: hypothetical protein UX36_C0001G0021 [Microgenomates group bacterium GW2011_GWC1_46_15]HAV15510.1 hypothetical protein [Candidatus Paceibacterota bacterium]HCR10835.1 hypothetical protein [Candidatus Paceibacterota bacterium]
MADAARKFFPEVRLTNHKLQSVVYRLQKVPFSQRDIENAAHLLHELQTNAGRDVLLAELAVTPDSDGGYHISLNKLLSLLITIRLQIPEEFDLDIFHKQQVFNERAQSARFGAVKLEGYTPARKQNDIDDAALLVACLEEAQSIVLPIGAIEELKKEEETAEEVVKAQGETSGGAGIPIPIIEKDKKKEKEEKEKKKQEEQKPPQPIDKDLYARAQDVDKFNIAYLKEAERIREAVLRGIAASYGVNDQQFVVFRNTFFKSRDELYPFILLELQKLRPEDVGKTGARLRLFRDIMIRAQTKRSFQDALFDALNSTNGKLFENKVQAKKRFAQQFASITPATIAQNIDNATFSGVLKNQENGKELEANLQKIAEFNQKAGSDIRSSEAYTDSLEKNLRTFLTTIHVPEQDINGVLLRLKALAITRANVDRMDEKAFERLFSDLFQSPTIQRNLEAEIARAKAAGVQAFSWQSFFLHYISAHRQQIYALTHQNGVLYADPTHGVRPQVTLGVEKALQAFGFKEVAAGLYGTSPQPNQAGARFRGTLNQHIQNFLGQPQGIQEYLVNQFAPTTPFSATVWKQLHQKEKTTQLYQLFMQYGVSQDFVQFLYLQNIGDDGLFEAGSALSEFMGEGFSAGQNSPMFTGAQDKNNLDRQLGQFVLTILAAGVLGPEAAAAIEKLNQVIQIASQIPVLGPIIQDAYNKLVEMTGKQLKLLLAILAGIMAAIALILGLIGWAIWQGAKWFFSQGVANLSGLLGVTKNLFAAVGKWALGGLTKFFTGLGAGFSSFMTQLSAGLGTVGGFSGAVVATTGLGVLGWGALTQQQRQLAFQTSVEGSIRSAIYATGVGNQGCWPTSGQVNGLDVYSSRLGGGTHGVHHGCETGLSGQNVCGVGPGLGGQAIDIGAPTGAPVYAPYPGVATFYPEGFGICSIASAFGIDCGYGNHVILKSTINGKDLVFFFGHLNDFGNFGAGTEASVSIGDVIGTVNSSGHSTGPHVHYEVHGAYRDEIVQEPPIMDGEVRSKCDPGYNTSTL